MNHHSSETSPLPQEPLQPSVSGRESSEAPKKRKGISVITMNEAMLSELNSSPISRIELEISVGNEVAALLIWDQEVDSLPHNQIVELYDWVSSYILEDEEFTPVYDLRKERHGNLNPEVFEMAEWFEELLIEWQAHISRVSPDKKIFLPVLHLRLLLLRKIENKIKEKIAAPFPIKAPETSSRKLPWLTNRIVELAQSENWEEFFRMIGTCTQSYEGRTPRLQELELEAIEDELKAMMSSKGVLLTQEPQTEQQKKYKEALKLVRKKISELLS